MSNKRDRGRGRTGPRYRTITASRALITHLEQLSEAVEEVLGDLPPERLEWLRSTKSADVRAGYLMGCADTLNGLVGDLTVGLRAWIHPDTGEIIGVDRMSDPPPPGFPPAGGRRDGS